MKIFKDHRGELAETFVLTDDMFLPVQEKMTKSKKNVFRGLHLSRNQDKHFMVIHGKVKDFVVNVKTGKVKSKILNPWDKVYIKKGLAHGFLTMSDYSIVRYLSDDYYDEKQEQTYSYKDFNIKIRNPILSRKDTR